MALHEEVGAEDFTLYRNSKTLPKEHKANNSCIIKHNFLVKCSQDMG
jgi:hypothetical protein